MPSCMNDRIAFSTEHFTVHRLDDPERPYRIDNGTGSTRLGEPACVTIRMDYGKARIAWTGIGARDAGDARLFARPRPRGVRRGRPHQPQPRRPAGRPARRRLPRIVGNRTMNRFEQALTPYMARRVLAAWVGGSHAHGLARPDSDIDLRIVIAPNPEDILLGSRGTRRSGCTIPTSPS